MMIPLDDKILNTETAQKWEWTQEDTDKGTVRVEAVYHDQDGTEHGLWALYTVEGPMVPVPGEFPQPLWRRYIHPAHVVRWFQGHGIELPPELSEFLPKPTLTDRRSARRARARRGVEL